MLSSSDNIAGGERLSDALQHTTQAPCSTPHLCIKAEELTKWSTS